jgi:hypothetical protein
MIRTDRRAEYPRKLSELTDAELEALSARLAVVNTVIEQPGEEAPEALH